MHSRPRVLRIKAVSALARILRQVFVCVACRYWRLRVTLAVFAAVTFPYAIVSLRGHAAGRGWLFFDQGWPFLYMSRAVSETERYGRWRVWSGIFDFDFKPLIQNLLVAAFLAVSLTELLHLLRGRARWFQISLRQACTLMLVVCCAAATCHYVHNRYRADQNRLRELEAIGWRTGYSNDNLAWYFQPLRDTMFLTEENWLFFRIEWDRADSDDVPAIDQFIAREVWNQRRLPFVRDVLIADTSLTDAGLRLLCVWTPNCSKLDLIECRNITADGVIALAENMTELRSLGLERMPLDHMMMQKLSKIRSLEQLIIIDAEGNGRSANIESLLALPNLKELTIPENWELRDEAILEFRARNIELMHATPFGRLRVMPGKMPGGE